MRLTPAELDRNRLLARVEGRKVARELCDLIGKDLNCRDFMLACVDQMLAQANISDMQLAERVGIQEPEPIARLAARQIPFGKYAEQTLDSIPLEYLDWLCRSQEDFLRNLRAYLKHPELKKRRPVEPSTDDETDAE